MYKGSPPPASYSGFLKVMQEKMGKFTTQEDHSVVARITLVLEDVKDITKDNISMNASFHCRRCVLH